VCTNSSAKYGMPAKKAVSIISSDSFDIGMRQLAMEFDAMDLDVNRSLDFSEFSQLIRSREMAVHSEKALRERFDALDVNGSGTVDMPEFIKFALRDALSRTALPIKSLLASWDTDGSQDIGIEEFRDAVRYFGFEARDAEIDAVFNEFDKNGNGILDINELTAAFAESAMPLGMKLGMGQKQLRRLSDREGYLTQAQAAAKLEAASAKLRPPARAPPPTGLKAPSKPIKTRVAEVRRTLLEVLNSDQMRVLDLFRAWDVNGDGLVGKQELRSALAGLGIEASVQVVDALFGILDTDNDGTLQYRELNASLRRTEPKIDSSSPILHVHEHSTADSMEIGPQQALGVRQLNSSTSSLSEISLLHSPCKPFGQKTMSPPPKWPQTPAIVTAIVLETAAQHDAHHELSTATLHSRAGLQLPERMPKRPAGALVGAFSQKKFGGASDSAKDLWSYHLGFTQGRLSTMQASVSGARLKCESDPWAQRQWYPMGGPPWESPSWSQPACQGPLSSKRGGTHPSCSSNLGSSAGATLSALTSGHGSSGAGLSASTCGQGFTRHANGDFPSMVDSPRSSSMPDLRASLHNKTSITPKRRSGFEPAIPAASGPSVLSSPVGALKPLSPPRTSTIPSMLSHALSPQHSSPSPGLRLAGPGRPTSWILASAKMVASGSLAGTTALRPETTPRPVLQGRKSPPPPPLLNEADWMASWLREQREGAGI